MELRQTTSAADPPYLVMIVRNIDHMVCIYDAPREESNPKNNKHRCKNLITDLDKVFLAVASMDPTNKEENPRRSPEGDYESIERDEKTHG